MDITLRVPEGAQIKKAKKLYELSFPRSERKPFCSFAANQKKGLCEPLAIFDGEEQCGLAFVLKKDDIVFLDYFATEPEKRGRGIGAEALSALRARYAGKRFILDIERCGPSAGENDMRARRKAFYLRCGMKETGVLFGFMGNKMELLSDGSAVAFDEYRSLVRESLPPVVFRMIALKES